MEERLVSLGIEMFKLSLFVSMPILAISMMIGLLVSIFQATTQINEMTLSFIPKILGAIAILILTMPWMLTNMVDYTRRMLELIPNFIF